MDNYCWLKDVACNNCENEEKIEVQSFSCVRFISVGLSLACLAEGQSI